MTPQRKRNLLKLPIVKTKTEEVLGRLETLFLKLDSEGLYVSANTVLMAIDEIRRLHDQQHQT